MKQEWRVDHDILKRKIELRREVLEASEVELLKCLPVWVMDALMKLNMERKIKNM